MRINAGGSAALLLVLSAHGLSAQGGSLPSPVTSLARTSWTRDRMAVIDVDDSDLPLVRIYRIVKAER